MAETAGGFCTGWKGIALTATAVAVLAVIAGTAFLGSQNTFPELVEAEAEFISSANAFGRDLFLQCITNETYAGTGWEAQLRPASGAVTAISLGRTADVAELGGLPETFVNPETNETEAASYTFRPEQACFAICEEALNCTAFTYDGLSEDRCRFLAPDTPEPEKVPVVQDFFYLYNASCLSSARDEFFASINANRTGLQRPEQDFEAGLDDNFVTSLQRSLQFLQAQWSGALPTGHNESIGWNKNEGFVELGNSCKTDYNASFVSGDHIVSTMAVATHLSVLALGTSWWNATYRALPGVLLTTRLEIVRAADFLTAAWDADAEELLMGIGTQYANATSPALLATSSFSTADRAFATGPTADPEGFPFGPNTTVAPQCEYATADMPAAEVAAHVSAALTLAALAESGVNAQADVAPWQAAAVQLLDLSVALTDGLSDEDDPGDVTDAFVAGERQVFGASEIYAISDPTYVYAHQFWAACVLFQSTGEETYWNQTVALYTRWINNGADGIDRQFFPVANFDNPVFYGLMCMAQSAPVATGFETLTGLEASALTNVDELLLTQEPLNATRLDAVNKLWANFVSVWLGAQDLDTDDNNDAVIKLADEANADDDSVVPLRVAQISEDADETLPGALRNSANAAWLSMMFADLPGVTAFQSSQARCMGVQTASWLIGANSISVGGSNSFSFQVGVNGNAHPLNPYHKDAACPLVATRRTRFTGLFKPAVIGEDDYGNPEQETDDSICDEQVGETCAELILTRECDFITFVGAPEPWAAPTNETNKEMPEDPPPGNIVNPTLDNAQSLLGALVSHFDVAGLSYNDARTLGTGGTPNEQARVAIDYNSALTNALVGAASLLAPADSTGCLSIPELRARIQEEFNARNSQAA